ncbi:MAG: preprotein translocase subunit SecA [Candidatus Staskawiczbacteria bacterium RIFCSPLOWO2_01_FULL_40_39]|uniref:Protein translocase subunit SecA n=1 Tax=Candidatus Staskawiczbacteria bacterium RIFCSPHIGHO2_01_FULL_39_25 TaxID=1802202 RepID=A0A1G2HNR0_9BACT|nr:MAG: preprotein translocase subunit SecA [Candidatus Staskawiczbacteria bacterium RIFCSPHIGHO2_01_FULL_39_25]OGZ73005.1 MAG: preprotein translocase subunit SecA [Candidatus Staskawiczbacteria bacterium RIFCSPLOWO2_01_FULL_40_39]
MSLFTKIFGDANQKFIKNIQPAVEQINSLEPEMQKLSAEQLKEKTKEFKERLQKGATLDDLLPEAFALVREAGKRTLNQRHFDVQLIGGIALHQGNIAEMRTGEGKTLSATLPAYLNALEGKGVHIVTVNEYLAKRDMIWMGQIYAACGLSTGCITNASGYVYDASYVNTEKDQQRDLVGSFKVVEDYLRPVSKKEAYQADITYGTNNEFGFDYLRDNMAYDLNQQAQRGHRFAIVDEVDSILIDEARVPLIISGEAEKATDKYYQFAKIVIPLVKEEDYIIDEKMKAVSFTENGQNNVVKSLGHDPWAENDIAATHQLESALRAKTLFLKDRDYVVKNGEIIIIDEFTGRMLPGRRWSAGLHQAVEAKEGVDIQPESTTLATITLQNYFRLYKKLSGMTGTALTSAEEFDKVYKLDVVVIPTHRPMVRKDFQDKIYKTEAGKFKAVIKTIKELHEKGQPVLVGTKSVERNEYLGKLLSMEGIPHQILNAKNHEQEGQIIAQAGKMGSVTIATNMAGRGVDILLGGNPATPEESQKVRDIGGLCVVGTERHDARRIDNQLRGRAGRQGDLGASEFFVSLEDDLMRIFGGDRIKSLMTALNVPEDEPIQAGMISGAIESAQEKIEGFNFDARRHLLEYDDVMNKHREIIYKKRREMLENFEFEISDFEKLEFKAEDFEKKKKELGEENFNQAARFVSLKVLDNLWQEHLSNMDHMRDSVRLRAYGGHDPLIEYKNEGRRLFQQLLEQMDFETADNILKASAQVQSAPRNNMIVNIGLQGKEVGRNDFCPCGSGKKFKKCGMLNTEEHKKLISQK